jgi:DNA-binding NarL/FixJ family response regulator
VLIVEDDPVFSYVLQVLLESAAELHVVGNVGTVAEAVEHPSLDTVDVVLIDVGLPGGDGLEGTRRLREFDPSLQVVVMSGSGFDLVATDALAAGAAAYLEKGDLHETLVATLISVGRRQHASPAA